MPCIPPFVDKVDNKSLHTLWNRKIYEFLRDFFATVEMGPPEVWDELGNPQIVRQEGTGSGWVIPWAEGGEGSGWKYSGDFAIVSVVLHSTEDGTFRAAYINGGSLRVNGRLFTLPETYVPVDASANLYLVLKDVQDPVTGAYNFQVSFETTVYGAISYVELGNIARVTPDTFDEDDQITAVGDYTITQKYLGGTGLNLVAAEDCNS